MNESSKLRAFLISTKYKFQDIPLRVTSNNALLGLGKPPAMQVVLTLSRPFHFHYSLMFNLAERIKIFGIFFFLF